MTVTTEKRILVCENCRSEFSCASNSGDCWCFAEQIDKNALIEIGENYTECLCRKCLCQISDKISGERFTTDKSSL